MTLRVLSKVTLPNVRIGTFSPPVNSEFPCLVQGLQVTVTHIPCKFKAVRVLWLQGLKKLFGYRHHAQVSRFMEETFSNEAIHNQTGLFRLHRLLF